MWRLYIVLPDDPHRKLRTNILLEAEFNTQPTVYDRYIASEAQRCSVLEPSIEGDLLCKRGSGTFCCFRNTIAALLIPE